jgi:hypothetical protein
MFRGHTLSVVIHSANDPRGAVDEFRRCAEVDEVLLVAAGQGHLIADMAAGAGVRVVDPGPGQSPLCAGLDAAKGDVLVWADPDCRGSDLERLLSSLESGSVVSGTRTGRNDAGFGRRWANRVLAKLVRLLWLLPNQPMVTDVGCGYSAVAATDWPRLRGRITRSESAGAVDLICAALSAGYRIHEVPVGRRSLPRGTSPPGVRVRDWGVLDALVAILRGRFSSGQKPAGVPQPR